MGNADDGLSAEQIADLTSGSIGVEAWHHLVKVRVVPDVLSSLEGPASDVVLAIDPDEAFRIASNLLAAARSALTRQVFDLQLGDCARCANTRLVDEQKHGRSERVHCPECRGPSMPPIPTLPVLVELERVVLA